MTDSQKWLLLVVVVGVGWLIYLLAPILTPFVAGALVAYFGDPVADKLEEWKLGRTGAVIVVFAAMGLIFALVLLLLVPMLENQIGRLVGNLPGYAAWIKETVIPWVKNALEIEGKLVDVDEIINILKSHWQKAGGVATTVIASISRSGLAVFAWIMNALLIPVVGFYMLRDWDVIVAKIQDLLPRRNAPMVINLAKEVDEVLGAFLRGQFSVMLALGLIYSTGLWMVGLDLALLIGIVAGVISFIPYLGSIVGVAMACIATLFQFHDSWYLLPVLAVFGIGQLLEGMVLTPILVGERIGLHPVTVIFAVLAGGQLFGFIGIILGLPVAAVIMVLLRHVHDIYRESEIYAEPDKGIPQKILVNNEKNL